MAYAVPVAVALSASAILLPGCGGDDGGTSSPSPTPTPPVLKAGGPEALVLDMAEGVVEGLLTDQIEGLLFPTNSIDYQTLMNNFLDATQQLLDQQVITEQEGKINGEMHDLNESNERFIVNPPPSPYAPPSPTPYTLDQARDAYLNDAGYKETIDDLYSDVRSQSTPVNSTLGVLEEYPSQSLAGWMSGAQVKVSFLGLQTQLSAIRNPSDLGNQAVLATDLGSPSGDDLIEYAITTRNGVLSANITDKVNEVGKCKNECTLYYQGICYDEETTTKDCNGKKHTWNGANNSSCNSFRAANIQSCGQDAYDVQSQEILWIDDVVNTWRDLLSSLHDQLPATAMPCAICDDAYSYIVVDEATISITGDLEAGTPQDATAWLQAACNGLQSCDYKLAKANFNESGPFTFVQVDYHCGSDAVPRQVLLTDGSPLLSEGSFIHLDCAPTIANLQATFRGQPVNASGGEVDVSTHSDFGLPTSLLTDGVFAPGNTPWNSTKYAAILPASGPEGGRSFVIDLEEVVTLCGNQSSACGNQDAQIQACDCTSYGLDVSLNGVDWTPWTSFPAASNRQNILKNQIASGQYGDINARYVRVYANPHEQTGKSSVSELEIVGKDPACPPGECVFQVTSGLPAFGPEPLVTNGEYAPAGTAWNNETYATVLSKTGTSYAVTIDLGLVTTLDHVIVQADHNDIYQLDVSTDNVNWSPWYTVQKVSEGGLQTRDSGVLTTETARYVRVYATSGDGKYSISEVQVFANEDLPDCAGETICAFSVAGLIEAQTGAAPTAEDMQDFMVSWTCGTASTLHTAHALPWDADVLVQATCPPSESTCDAVQPTKCSNFLLGQPDDAVYTNIAKFPYEICPSTQYPKCVQVIQGKTNYYHCPNASTSCSIVTMNDPACQNVRRAISGAINEGSCPLGLGATGANASNNVWPYANDIGAGANGDECLPYPGSQPSVLAAIGCEP